MSDVGDLTEIILTKIASCDGGGGGGGEVGGGRGVMLGANGSLS